MVQKSQNKTLANTRTNTLNNKCITHAHTYTHTFEEVGSEACLVDRPVRDKLHPQRVSRGAHVLGFVVAAEPANKRARLQGAVTNFQVVVSTAVVPLDLRIMHAHTHRHTHDSKYTGVCTSILLVG